MRVLFLVSTFGPAEAQLLENAQGHGHQVDVLDVQGPGWLRRSAPQNRQRLERWLTYWPLRAARNQIARVMRDVVARGAYDAYLALSLPAAGFAARFLEEPFVPVLFRGDLDFSAARVQLTQDVLDLTTAVDRIFLQDEYEYDKALSKSSRSAHLLHLRGPVHPVHEKGLALRSAEAPRVVMLHPERVTEERVNAQADMLRRVAEHHGGSLTTLSASAFYRARDLRRNRNLYRTARARLAGATHVVLTGSSRDHEAVADLILRSGDADRLVVEDTIGMGNWARSRDVTRTGRGARLAGLLHGMLGTGPDESPAAAGGAGTATAEGPDLVAGYLAAMDERVDREHEQLRVLDETGPLDVFFSTSPLEDRTDGARPQRVRNMAESMDDPGAAVRLYSTPSVFGRRAALVRRLLEAGRPAGLLYGENSTTPIPFGQIPSELAELARLMRAHGGHSAWFVRDLHWLEDFDGYLDETEMRDRMRHDGLRELQCLADAVDVLVAPSAAAGRGFNDLLARHSEQPRQWYPMPPAISPQNIADALPEATGATDAAVTLLYAGGVSSLYGLDEYLSAVQYLGDDLLLDFVVRPHETELLDVMLDRHGLVGRPGLRVLTESLEWYVPRTGRCIGAVLLGGEYARFSFPYKTMSLLERGYAVLCFEDMAIAGFVRENRIGVACARTPQAIREAITGLVDDELPGWVEARRQHTWSARLTELRTHLARQDEHSSTAS